MARVYCVKSLVPIEKKSHSFASSSAMITAAGVSTIIPTVYVPILTFFSSSSFVHSAKSSLHSLSSLVLIIIGNIIPKFPNADALNNALS